VTRENGTTKGYANGILMTTDNTIPLGITTSDLVTIGQTEGTYQFDGHIDEVRIYKRALSSGEVQALYTTNLKKERGPYIVYGPHIETTA
jgi:hypothetical protein